MLHVFVYFLEKVLCLSPTFELAIQTGEVAAHMAKFCPEIEMKYAVRGEEGFEVNFLIRFKFTCRDFSASGKPYH